MNVKLVFADKIESWDTRADGSATTSHAALEIRGRDLVLWSALDFDDDYRPDGTPEKRRRERGTPRVVLSIGEQGPSTLPDFLGAAGEEHGLLRFDVDGETIWQSDGLYQDEGESEDGDGDEDLSVEDAVS